MFYPCTRLLAMGLIAVFSLRHHPTLAQDTSSSAPGAPSTPSASSSEIKNSDRAFWAFCVPTRPAMPRVKALDRLHTPIDAFLLARLEERGLSYNRDSSESVLLRRLCFDLLGLPPTPEQFEAFLADERPDAYERLVDQLLASPRYGERWGRHWLDIAGYADSDGYLAADRLRPEAWRYRDYVIRAHNEDLPFNAFVLEQLAGDELSDWRRGDELQDDVIRQLAATGFLRTASDPTYPGYTEPNEIHQVIGDTLQIVGSAFLGLTVQCARCHDHKIDPLSQRDYYAFEAIFLPALDPARWQPSEVRGIPLATEAEQARIAEWNTWVEERVKVLAASLDDVTKRYRRKMLSALLAERLPPLEPAAMDKLTEAVFTPVDKRNDEQKLLIASHAPDIVLGDDQLATRFPAYHEEAQRLRSALAAEAALKKSITLVRGLTDLNVEAPQGRVLLRGDYRTPGDAVAPGLPQALVPVGYPFQPHAGYKTTGRRTALARWLTSPENPLTARVETNRIWARHMGRGLVSTLANFGHSGARPTHPELLDWLATEFVRRGWSRKAMHRTIVTSTAYRQTSDVDPAKADRDPDNLCLGAWQPRRHDGEVLRDSVLAVAGKLNLQVGGPPSPVTVQPDGSVTTSDDVAGNRRSVYLQVRRSQHLTLLELFDTPLMEINCPQRTVSTVPLQALAMLHSSFAEASAAALGARAVQSGADDAARVAWIFRLLLTREPTDAERQAIQEFLAAITRKQLADRQIPDSAAKTAAQHVAWTQAALVLLNSNEFTYIH